MKEIKSIRIRRLKNGGSGEIDVKLTLNLKVDNLYEVIWQPNGSVKTVYDFNLKDFSQKKKDIFTQSVKNGVYTEQVIVGFSKNNLVEGDVLLNEVILQRQRVDFTEYEVIQDPWKEKPPIFRKFGYDPYYLNNGAILYINWYKDGFIYGGREWSDENGKELSSLPGDINNIKTKITKIIKIFAPSDYKGEDNKLVLNSNGEIEDARYVTKELEYIGITTDDQILESLLVKWTKKVPNYTVDICSPNNEYCNILEYVSPLNPVELSSNETNIDTNNNLNLNIDFNTFKEVRVREDIGFLKISIV